jgi:hypothetical protein
LILLSVFPTQAGISWFDRVMDSRSRGSDGLRDFSPVIKTEESGHMLGMVDLTDLGKVLWVMKSCSRAGREQKKYLLMK